MILMRIHDPAEDIVINIDLPIRLIEECKMSLFGQEG